MDTKLNTQGLYQSLQSDLQQLDEERLQTRQKLLRVNLIWIPIAIAELVTAIYFVDLGGGVMFAGFFVFVILIVVWAMQRSTVLKPFVKNFKERVIGRIVKKIDPSFAYAPDGERYYSASGLPQAKQLSDTSLFPSFSIYTGEDRVTGVVKDMPFEFKEVTLETSGKNGKVVYHGVVITIQLKNALPSPIYILPDSANQLRDSLWKMMHLKTNRGEVVLLDHEEFERLYKVYCADPNLPGKLLRKNFLDRLVLIHDKVGKVNRAKDAIRVSMIEHTVTLSVRLTVNLFEPKINASVSDQKYFEENVQYLVLFLSLIEDLNLNG